MAPYCQLGPAAEIDESVAAWRDAIESGRGAFVAPLVRERIWDKLAPHLPKGTKTLYIAADGDLARVPWAALPIGDNRVLLEEYTVARRTACVAASVEASARRDRADTRLWAAFVLSGVGR